ARIRENIHNVLASYLASGLDPALSTIVVQSQIPEIHELYVYFSMIVTIASLQQNPTTKNEIKLGYNKNLSLGFLGYPVHQAADIAVFRANLVPVGQDQVPHIEEARHLVRKFNGLYGADLVEPEAKVGATPILPGLDGKEKMSKSLGNAIYLCDEDNEIKNKLQKAVTDPARIHVTDKGHPDICTIFKYYQAFFPADVTEVRDKCENAKWGCGHCKKQMLDRMTGMIKPMRDTYQRVRKDEAYLNQILKEGCVKGRERAASTMDGVRKKMSLQAF
ncbi:MAG: tryptophan--tRNA ligase, partial [Spirochaetia bacterium]|nr:tryptophan--tRNA ligase [Spirochaetia bacterium]